MTIEIIREAADRLSREVWVFWLDIGSSGVRGLHVDSYRPEVRETTRHKYKLRGFMQEYRRLNARDSRIDRSGLPLPENVIAEARRRICTAVMALEVTR